MPLNFSTGLSPAGMSLGLNNLPGLTGTAGLGDALEIRRGAQAEAGADCAAAVPSHPEQFTGCELVVRRPGRL